MISFLLLWPSMPEMRMGILDIFVGGQHRQHGSVPMNAGQRWKFRVLDKNEYLAWPHRMGE
jgi:hypothetical protein